MQEILADGDGEYSLTAAQREAVDRSAREKFGTWEWNFGHSPETTHQGRKKFACGTVEVLYSLKNGVLTEVSFQGDFLGDRPAEELANTLKGKRLQELASLDVSAWFDGMDLYIMRKNLTFLLTFLMLLTAVPASAQVYSGYRKFDGVHKNEINGSLFYGFNVVTGTFIGENAIYTRHFSPRWSISAGQQVQFLKQVYSIDITGTYRIPITKKANVYIDGRVMFSRYQRWKVNEPVVNLSAYLETNYVDLRWGWSYIRYPNRWNLGLFFRNFDQYYYENWNINWGVRFHCTLPHDIKLFSEFNIRPAGSISQLATRYETSLKVGLKYAW